MIGAVCGAPGHEGAVDLFPTFPGTKSICLLDHPVQKVHGLVNRLQRVAGEDIFVSCINAPCEILFGCHPCLCETCFQRLRNTGTLGPHRAIGAVRGASSNEGAQREECREAE